MRTSPDLRHTRAHSYVAAIIHLPSTLLYHVRLLTDRHSNDADEDERKFYSMLLSPPATVPKPSRYKVHYVEFTVRYAEDERRWTVERIGESHSGWMAANMDSNIGPDGRHSNEATIAALVSSKQRYIDLHKCSEHQHHQCYRLLRARPPRHVTYRSAGLKHSPPISPLPLCAVCCTAIAACVERAGLKPACWWAPDRDEWRVGVLRINRTEYEASYTHWEPGGVTIHSVRVAITLRQRLERQHRESGEEEVSKCVTRTGMAMHSSQRAVTARWLITAQRKTTTIQRAQLDCMLAQRTAHLHFNR